MKDLLSQLHYWAEKTPASSAFMFASRNGSIEQTITFGELLSHSTSVAAGLSERKGHGKRALLVFRPGVQFLVGFLGCLLAGVIAVPMAPPRRLAARDSSDAIAANAQPRFVLSQADMVDSLRKAVALRPAWQGLEWLAIETLVSEAGKFTPCPSPVAFLQYTSGSTSSPKGVKISHSSLAANLEMIQRATRTSSTSVMACWLPLFHDMGLIGNGLHSVYAGSRCILMAPNDFMMRPINWLRIVSDHRADFAGGPNFAYDRCVDRFRPGDGETLDLSCWRIAFNGAEPVRASTLDRFGATFGSFGFDSRRFFPCYGMAEATVMISGKTNLESAPVRRPHDGTTLIGCGAALPGEEIAVVDPDERRRVDTNSVGEIWIRGSNIASGYWGNRVDSEETFGAKLQGENELWLRTGDLGLVDEDGELFISGRLKDMIIVRGENHYPHDIEWTARESHAAFGNQMGVSFMAEENGTEPRLVVLQELDRAWRGRVALADLETVIREAVALEHGLSVHQATILQPGSLPRTTSGKIQRVRARALWLANAFDRHDQSAV